MSLVIALVGLGVGTLVGLTGVGGGTLLTPILVLLGIPVPAAVGTDLVYNVGTKFMGTLQHARQGSVDLRWAAALGAGGIPGAIAGSLLGGQILRATGSAQWLMHAVGGALILAALGTVLPEALRLYRRRRGPAAAAPEEPPAVPPIRLVPFGAAIGVLVGLTSIGSGALVAPALLLWSGLPARRIVGTDIANGLMLTAAAGLAHSALGTVDWTTVLNLVIGSVPGAWIGSRLTLWIPARPLRTVLSGLVLLSGLRLM